MSVFFTSWKTGFKSWLDTSSIPYCLSSFFSYFLSLSWQLLDTWWIDQESSCLLDSFSTPGGSIKLLFLDLMSCSSIPTRYLNYRRPFPWYLSRSLSYRQPFPRYLSIPTSIELYWGSIYSFLCNLILIYSISLDLSALVYLPNTISLTPNLFLCDFSSFFKFFLLLVSY